MGLGLPLGIEPVDAKCRTCGKVFKAKVFTKTITGKPMNPELLDADDQLIAHELQTGHSPDGFHKTEFFAKNGFMGMIDTKTKFTVGEKGKREFVSRTPSKSILDQQMDFFSTPNKKKGNNIFDVGF